jgi:hypothetical protein
LLWAQTAMAMTIWSFDLPATATASQSPPYPVVATLTLTQTADGVQFVLDPNEESPGFLANAADGFIERIDYVYTGPKLKLDTFRNDDGAIDGFHFERNPNRMDSGYRADEFFISVDFPSRRDPERFTPDQTRVWTVLGATLSQFTDTFATANSKPTPISGILSVTGYSLRGKRLSHKRPTPSNWVHTVESVPQPGASPLLSIGVLALGAKILRRARPRFHSGPTGGRAHEDP